MPVAVLSNGLWIPRSIDVRGTPDDWAPEWVTRIPLLKTPEGKAAQQAIAVAREQAIDEGLNPDDFGKPITEDDCLTLRNWKAIGKWWFLCGGDVNRCFRLCEKLGLEVRDQRVEVPWPEDVSSALKMVMTPRDYQPEPFYQWLKAGHGVFQADPAFGKTYVMIWSLLERKQRTIVLVHTDILAGQFITRFRHGSPQPDGSYKLVTNCTEAEDRLGVKIVGRYQGPDNLFPVTVATWQAFAGKPGRAALEKVKDQFGVVLVDEAHVFAAKYPALVVSKFSAKVKAGVTATPQRKDQMEIGLTDVIGPVTAHGIAPTLPVTAYLIATGERYKPPRYPSMNEWSKVLNWLVKRPDRNDLIIEWLKWDVLQDNRRVLVLAERTKWCLAMAEILTKEHGIESRAILGGLKTKKYLAYRQQVQDDMMLGKVSVIFATQVFKAGVDIPCLDTVYDALPGNNAPQLEQKLGRMRRPYDEKRPCHYRYFVDGGFGMLIGCAKGTQRALVEGGCNLVVVPEGRKPAKVMAGGPIFGPQAGLRAAAAKTDDAISGLFDDLTEEHKQTNKYKRRLGKS